MNNERLYHRRCCWIKSGCTQHSAAGRGNEEPRLRAAAVCRAPWRLLAAHTAWQQPSLKQGLVFLGFCCREAWWSDPSNAESRPKPQECPGFTTDCKQRSLSLCLEMVPYPWVTPSQRHFSSGRSWKERYPGREKQGGCSASSLSRPSSVHKSHVWNTAYNLTLSGLGANNSSTTFQRLNLLQPVFVPFLFYPH